MKSLLKKARGKNFTEIEKATLVDIISDFKNIIENKKTDGTTLKAKNEAWHEISTRFNAASCNSRSASQLRATYKGLKHQIRKNINAEKV